MAQSAFISMFMIKNGINPGDGPIELESGSSLAGKQIKVCVYVFVCVRERKILRDEKRVQGYLKVY